MSDRKLHTLQPVLCLILASLLLILAACDAKPQAATPAAPGEPTASPTETPAAIHILNLEPSATPQPAATSTPTEIPQLPQTAAPTQVASATATEPACLGLREPENGATLPSSGWRTFAWDAWEGAANYLLEITAPNGWVLSIETSETSNLRALEALSLGGEYTWTVIALNAQDQALCQPEPRRFSKPEYQTQTEPERGQSVSNEEPEKCNCGP